MNKMVSTRTGFGTGLVELAGMRDDVVTTSADTYRSFALNKFVGDYQDGDFPWVTAPSSLCVGWSRYVHLPHIPTSM